MNITSQESKQLKIIALFTIAIVTSFIPETFPNFFGDYVCNDITIRQEDWRSTVYCSKYQHSVPVVHWGYRHWLFFIMGAILFFLNFFRILFNEK